jgi:hypothetical protein
VIGVEVVLGFAVGYWIGTRQGRKGWQEALDSAQAIWASPETKRLLGEALTVLEAAAGPAMERLGGGKSSRNRVALLGSVVDELIERRSRRAA